MNFLSTRELHAEQTAGSSGGVVLHAVGTQLRYHAWQGAETPRPGLHALPTLACLPLLTSPNGEGWRGPTQPLSCPPCSDPCVCVLAPALLCVFGGVLVWRLRLPLVARAAAPGLAAAPDVYFNTSKECWRSTTKRLLGVD